VNPRVRFEDEADAGVWYESRREHLGIEFFEAADKAISQILDLPRSAPPYRA
jgi:hypothetical protein